ncbi:MAG: DUF4249 domain-containing protein [Bacteroidia bacterium]|nr:DUF4249 domain-containing protein [Bacteroidia bacterium]
MKNILSLLLLAGISLSACTEIIQIELNDSEPRYVMEANLSAENQRMELRIALSGSFTDAGTYDVVSNATVTLSDDEGRNWALLETSPGQYTRDSIHTQAGMMYQVKVLIGGESFFATSVMPEAVLVDSVAFQYISNPNIGTGWSPIIYYQSLSGEAPSLQVHISGPSGGPQRSFLSFDNVTTESQSRILQASYPKGMQLQLRIDALDRSAYDYLQSVAELVGEGIGPTSAAPTNPDPMWTGGALGYFSAHTSSEISVVVE